MRIHLPMIAAGLLLPAAAFAQTMPSTPTNGTMTGTMGSTGVPTAGQTIDGAGSISGSVGTPQTGTTMPDTSVQSTTGARTNQRSTNRTRRPGSSGTGTTTPTDPSGTMGGTGTMGTMGGTGTMSGTGTMGTAGDATGTATTTTPGTPPR
jgi:hypothetical protein